MENYIHILSVKTWEINQQERVNSSIRSEICDTLVKLYKSKRKNHETFVDILEINHETFVNILEINHATLLKNILYIFSANYGTNGPILIKLAQKMLNYDI